MVKIQSFKLSSDKNKHKNKTKQHIGEEENKEERHEYRVITMMGKVGKFR